MIKPAILDESAINEIEARANAATPEPLGARIGSGQNVCTALCSEAEEAFDQFVCDVLPDYAINLAPRWEANRDFIEHAYTDIPALCATVKHLWERVQLLDSRWCECGHTKDKHGFFSDHDECHECDQASPDLCCEWRPVARPDTQLEHLQSQLEQLRAENERLEQSVTFWQAEALLNHFCSEHASKKRQAGFYCTICAKPFAMSVPQGERPPKYAELKERLAQVEQERDELRTQLNEWESLRDKIDFEKL